MEIFLLEKDTPLFMMNGSRQEGLLCVGVYSSAERAKRALIKAGFDTPKLQEQFTISATSCDDDVFKVKRMRPDHVPS